MKVFDLVCAGGHRFEGWFASADDFAVQVVRCPLCDITEVRRAPSAPRLNLGAGEVAVTSQGDVALAAAAMLKRLRRIVSEAEDVGPRFADEARRIHYDEAQARSIRGTATAHERRALDEEGIETVAIALPSVLTETLQ